MRNLYEDARRGDTGRLIRRLDEDVAVVDMELSYEVRTGRRDVAEWLSGGLSAATMRESGGAVLMLQDIYMDKFEEGDGLGHFFQLGLVFRISGDKVLRIEEHPSAATQQLLDRFSSPPFFDSCEPEGEPVATDDESSSYPEVLEVADFDDAMRVVERFQGTTVVVEVFAIGGPPPPVISMIGTVESVRYGEQAERTASDNCAVTFMELDWTFAIFSRWSFHGAELHVGGQAEQLPSIKIWIADGDGQNQFIVELSKSHPPDYEDEGNP